MRNVKGENVIVVDSLTSMSEQIVKFQSKKAKKKPRSDLQKAQAQMAWDNAVIMGTCGQLRKLIDNYGGFVPPEMSRRILQSYLSHIQFVLKDACNLRYTLKKKEILIKRNEL